MQQTDMKARKRIEISFYHETGHLVCITYMFV